MSSGPTLDDSGKIDCMTGLLADPGFRARFAARSGLDEARLAAEAVTDPETTVRVDVARLVLSSAVPPTIVVSGHIYNLDSGLVTTLVEGERPTGA